MTNESKNQCCENCGATLRTVRSLCINPSCPYHSQDSKEVNYMSVGRTIECSECFPNKNYYSCQKFEQEYGTKCKCICHDPAPKPEQKDICEVCKEEIELGTTFWSLKVHPNCGYLIKYPKQRKHYTNFNEDEAKRLVAQAREEERKELEAQLGSWQCGKCNGGNFPEHFRTCPKKNWGLKLAQAKQELIANLKERISKMRKNGNPELETNQEFGYNQAFDEVLSELNKIWKKNVIPIPWKVKKVILNL